jgi:hypothetical protein
MESRVNFGYVFEHADTFNLDLTQFVTIALLVGAKTPEDENDIEQFAREYNLGTQLFGEGAFPGVQSFAKWLSDAVEWNEFKKAFNDMEAAFESMPDSEEVGPDYDDDWYGEDPLGGNQN